MDNAEGTRLNLVTGITLMAGAVLAIFLMFHHPSTSSEELGTALQEISDEGAISAWVHGMLILVMVAIWFGTFGLSHRLGLSRALSVLGLIFFGLGTLAYCQAAMISGFIVPQIGSTYSGATPDQWQHALGLLRLSGIANQSFASAGLIGTSLGIIAWSVILLGRSSIIRWAGGFGLAMGVFPIVMLVTGNLKLHLSGMTAVVVAHGIWYMLAGAMMVWGPLKQQTKQSN